VSEGHEHHEVRIPPGRLGKAVVWALARPVWRTTDIGWADRSRMVFKPGKRDGTWVLSTLGILHGRYGLTLIIPPDPDIDPDTEDQT
jgi:hypothetical protein